MASFFRAAFLACSSSPEGFLPELFCSVFLVAFFFRGASFALVVSFLRAVFFSAALASALAWIDCSQAAIFCL